MIILDKLVGNQRKVLHHIYKNRKKHLTRFTVKDGLPSISGHEVSMHLRQLVKDEYIFYSGANQSVNMTSKGLSYFHRETQDNLELCIKSFVFPIVVAYVTTMITLLLQN